MFPPKQHGRMVFSKRSSEGCLFSINEKLGRRSQKGNSIRMIRDLLQVMDEEASIASEAMAETMMQSIGDALTQPAPRHSHHSGSALQVLENLRLTQSALGLCLF